MKSDTNAEVLGKFIFFPLPLDQYCLVMSSWSSLLVLFSPAQWSLYKLSNIIINYPGKIDTKEGCSVGCGDLFGEILSLLARKWELTFLIPNVKLRALQFMVSPNSCWSKSNNSGHFLPRICRNTAAHGVIVLTPGSTDVGKQSSIKRMTKSRSLKHSHIKLKPQLPR